MPTSELPYGAIKVFIALVGAAGAGSLIMWLGSGTGTSSTIRSWEIVRASQQDASTKKNFSEAETLGKQAIRLAERLGSSNYRVGISHDDIGEILVKENKPDEAWKHFDDAEKILQTNIIRANDEISKRLLLSDLAWVQRNLALLKLSERYSENLEGHSQKAEGHSKKAEEYLKDGIANLEMCIRNKKDGRIDYFAAHRQVDLMLRLASLNVASGRLEDAQKWFRKAILLADESFYPAFLMKQAREQFSKLLKQEGNIEEAEALFSHERWVKQAQAAEEARSKEDYEATAKNLREAANSAKGSKATMHLAIISLKKLAKLQLQQGNNSACRETCMEALHLWQTLGASPNSEADDIRGIISKVSPRKK